MVNMDKSGEGRKTMSGVLMMEDGKRLDSDVKCSEKMNIPAVLFLLQIMSLDGIIIDKKV